MADAKQDSFGTDYTTGTLGADSSSRSSTLPAGRKGDFVGRAPYLKRWRSLLAQRERLLPLWRVLNQTMAPWTGRFLFNEKEQVDIWRGDEVNNGIIFEAINTCVAGLKGSLTSPQKPWFNLATYNRKQMEGRAVRGWLDDTCEIMRDVLAGSNFYPATTNIFHESAVYGPGVAVMDPHPQNGINTRPLTVGEYCLAEGADGSVNTCYWRMEMTIAQLKENFGESNPAYSQAILDAMGNPGSQDGATYTVIRAMQPTGMFGGKVPREFTFESVYFLENSGRPNAGDDEPILEWRGHRTKPFIAVRWRLSGSHPYGWSAGMQAMADNVMLQEMEADYIDGLQKAVAPAVIGPSDLIKKIKDEGGVKAGMAYEETQGRADALRPAYEVRPDFGNLRLKTADIIGNLRVSFYRDLFMSMLETTRQMTAYEASERIKEKFRLLAPIVENYESEMYNPALDREYTILLHEYNMIPPPPEEIAGQPFKIEYVGEYSSSLNQIESMNIKNGLPLMLELAKVDPGVLDVINVQELVMHLTKIDGWPSDLTRGKEEIAQLQAERAQAAQTAAQPEAMAGIADTAQKLGSTPISPDNALGALLGDMGEGGGLGQ